MPKARRYLIALCAVLGLSACVPGAAPQTDATLPAEADRDVFLTLAASIAEGGKPQAALAYLDDYLIRYPDDDRALLLKADCLARTGHPNEAKNIYERLAARTASPPAVAGLGRIAAGKGDWATAAGRFAQAYGQTPSDPRLLNDYGYALLMTGHPGQAFTVLARAHELKPGDPFIRTNFLLAAQALGRRGDISKTLAPLSAPERQRLLAFLETWRPSP